MSDHLRLAGSPAATQQGALIDFVTSSPFLMGVLTRARSLDLPDSWLVAGAIYNLVWNRLTGRPALKGIKDADLFYFDDSDLSYEAEDRVIQRARFVFADIPVPVEIRNQARVHLWFAAHFGTDYPPLRSSREGVDRFSTRAHAIALRLEADDAISVYAPFGLDDLFSFRLIPNHAIENEATHCRKAAKALSLWPELTFLPW